MKAQKGIKMMHALHGFLGQPDDWARFPFSLKKWNLFEVARPASATGLVEWAQQFNARVVQESHPQRVLMGYSLGGRLALHALLQNPKMWDAAILISARPGLLQAKDRELRLQKDKAWAAKFRTDSWEVLMKEWNSQECFKASPPISERKESDFSRELLADALTYWSLGAQEDLSPHLAQLKIPLLWIVGDLDCRATKDVVLCHPHSECWIAPNAGHRVPWDVTEAFCSKVQKFLKTLHTSKRT